MLSFFCFCLIVTPNDYIPYKCFCSKQLHCVCCILCQKVCSIWTIRDQLLFIILTVKTLLIRTALVLWCKFHRLQKYVVTQMGSDFHLFYGWNFPIQCDIVGGLRYHTRGRLISSHCVEREARGRSFWKIHQMWGAFVGSYPFHLFECCVERISICKMGLTPKMLWARPSFKLTIWRARLGKRLNGFCRPTRHTAKDRWYVCDGITYRCLQSSVSFTKGAMFFSRFMLPSACVGVDTCAVALRSICVWLFITECYRLHSIAL